MVWTVDMDDFNGTVCGSGVKYPLIGAMREELLSIPRDVVAPGIEPADIDWESVASSFLPISATTLPPASQIDIQTLLRDSLNKNNQRVLPALLQRLPDNKREARIFCYYTNWSNKRPGMGQFTPEDVDPGLCTHIVLSLIHI